MVAVWIVAGIVWVALNPRMRGVKVLGESPPKRAPAATSVSV